MALEKFEGGPYGATIWFVYRGPGEEIWVGLGLRHDPYDYWDIPEVNWLGGYVTVPKSVTETQYSIDLNGIFPGGIPGGILLDTWKILAPSYPLLHLGNQGVFDGYVLSKDRDDEVYTTPPSVFDVSRPDSSYW